MLRHVQGGKFDFRVSRVLVKIGADSCKKKGRVDPPPCGLVWRFGGFRVWRVCCLGGASTRLEARGLGGLLKARVFLPSFLRTRLSDEVLTHFYLL